MRIPFLLPFLFIYISISGQDNHFDTFMERLTDQYKVNIAIASELLPALDSFRNEKTEITSLNDFLQEIFNDQQLAYQIIDGNKVLVRRETTVMPVNTSVMLQGIILDKKTKSPLAFAAISEMNSSRGTYADEEGRFTLYVDPSATTLQISYLGYQTFTVSISELLALGGTVELTEESIPLDQVVIIVPFRQISSHEAQSLDLKGYQFVNAEDLLHWNSERLISRLTGYTHYSSEQGIRIRGSEEENSLILMDGIPVYDPYHFYNIFGPFNGYYFPTLHLYKNNMPVMYGGRIDGLIELDSRQENETELVFDTDLLLTSAAANFALTDKISFKAGGRFSHTGLINESLKDSTSANFKVPGKFIDENEWTASQEPTFNFYDVNLGLNILTGKQGAISMAYFKSNDYLRNKYENDLTTTLINQEVISIDQSISSRDVWKNEGLSAGYESRLSNNFQFNFQGFISGYEKDVSYRSSIKETFPMMMRMSVNKGHQNSLLQSWGFKVYGGTPSTSSSGYLIGADIQRHELDLVAVENNSPYLLELQKEYESTLFGEYRTLFFRKFEIGAGGRLTHLRSTSSVYLQPNVRINYLPGEEWIIKTSFSKNIQSIRELTVENRFGREVDFLALSQPDAGYSILRSDKYMAGFGYGGKYFSLDGELYYKKVDGLISIRAIRPDPSFQDDTDPGDFYKLFKGDGWTAGMDLIATYQKGNWESTLSYTLSKITERYDDLFNGNPFSPTEDRRHQLKLSSQLQFGSFLLSGLLNYKTRAPYVSFVRLGRDGSIDMVDQDMVVRYLPPYLSIDLGVEYGFRIADNEAQLGFSLINATNHENINDLQHIGRIARDAAMRGLYLTQQTELLGRTFNVHLICRFSK